MTLLPDPLNSLPDGKTVAQLQVQRHMLQQECEELQKRLNQLQNLEAKVKASLLQYVETGVVQLTDECKNLYFINP